MQYSKYWITSMIQAPIIQSSDHNSRCGWPCDVQLNIVLRTPDSLRLSVIFLFFKQVSTPLSSASWNTAFWARFSIDQLPLDHTAYAPGLDSRWETDSLRQDLLVVRTSNPFEDIWWAFTIQGVLWRDWTIRKLTQQERIQPRAHNGIGKSFNNWSCIINEKHFNDKLLLFYTTSSRHGLRW